MQSSNHTEHYIKELYYPHAQNTTALRPNELLTGVHRLLVTSKGWSAFARVNHC